MGNPATPEIVRAPFGSPGLTNGARFYLAAATPVLYTVPERLLGGYLSIRFFTMAVDPTAVCDVLLTNNAAAVVPVVATNIPSGGTPIVENSGVGRRLTASDPPLDIVIPTATDRAAARTYLAACSSAEGWIELFVS